MEQRHPLWSEIDRVERRILKLSNPVIKRDLDKMLKNIFLEMASISKESVECRRLNRVTTRYITLNENVEEHLKKIDKYLSMYSLLG